MPKSLTATWDVKGIETGSDPFEHCWLNIVFNLNPAGLRAVRRLAADMRQRPDIQVDLTIGRGLWRRNGRLRLTGPHYAIRPALDTLRDVFKEGRP